MAELLVTVGALERFVVGVKRAVVTLGSLRKEVCTSRTTGIYTRSWSQDFTLMKKDLMNKNLWWPPSKVFVSFVT